ncbi:MAG: glycoside hydrolase family 3 N-terminal domain-containing protein [Bacteroidales bacterium]
MNFKYLLLLVSCIATVSAVQGQKSSIYKSGWTDLNKNGEKDVYEDSSAPVEARVQDLLKQMTLDEKTCQMATLYGYGRVLKDSLPTAGWKNEIWKDGIANIDEQLNGIGGGRKRSPHLIYPFSKHAEAINTTQRWFIEETRLGIPVDFTNEGIHGLNHTKATPLPAPINIGSTWNRSLVHQAGNIVGKEAKALGYTNVYAPILDLARDPRWGRVLECYSEDPYLISELGVQMVNGIQQNGVASTLKHYAVYSIPKGGRDASARTDPHVAPRELHEIHMYPFKKVIQKSHPKGVMSSYNDWDGVPVTASHYFLTELLRWEYGFRGYVVSDSEAVEFVQSKHRVAATYEDAVRQVVEAGLNVRTNFTKPSDYILPLRKIVEEGKLSMASVDRMVADVLRVKFELGLFDSPYVEDPQAADELVGADKHSDFVLEMQKQSLVLLKNENNLLPLDKSKIKKILIAGPLAKETNYMVSRYGPTGLDNVTVYDGLKDYLGKDVEIAYAKGCEVKDANWPDSEIVPTPLTEEEKGGIDEAVKAASDCDLIIAVLGEDERCTGESKSRTSLDLPGRQQKLLEALHATDKPVVLVLINGQPLTINWADRNIPSILEAWFPGQKGGEAIAQTLFGDYNPGGRLPVTFPRSVGQIEFNFPFKPGSHGGQYFSGPNGSGNTRVNSALYPFGYGLSYTTFAYSNLIIKQETPYSQSPVKVSVDVSNTGKYAGDEVVQLYVSDKVSSVITYESLLRGFERVSLKPGETKTVSFVLLPEDLQILDKDMNWTVEPGEFEVRIGDSSEGIKLKDSFEVK